MQFDHQSRTIHFDARGAEVEGPREHLSHLARSLFQAMQMIQPVEADSHAKRTSQVGLPDTSLMRPVLALMCGGRSAHVLRLMQHL